MSSLLKQVKATLPEFILTLPEKNKPSRWLPQVKALEYERIRMHLNDKHFLIIDYDVKEGLNLPVDHSHYDIEPNFIVYNPMTLSHQAYWFLRDPVHCQKDSRFKKPYLYLKAVQAGYDEKYSGDIHFARHISRNPLAPFAETDWLHDRKFSLSELSEPIELNSRRIDSSKRRQERRNTNTDVEHRNCEVFTDLITWAMKGHSFQYSKQEEWLQRCLTQALSYNVFKDKNPMDLGEVQGIAKSVSNYTFHKLFDKKGSSERFSAKQAKRGRLGGLKSKGGGRPHSEIALSKTQPWLEHGISRATYYRRIKLGLL